jgi:carboxylate-amine ligase
MSEVALTIGIEEEFLLVGPDGCTKPQGPEVLAQLPADRFKGELQPTQIEAITPVRANLNDLAADLHWARAQLAEAAATLGLLVLPVGSPPMGGLSPDLIMSDDRPRYQAIKRLYAGSMDNYDVCACQLHVGIGNDDELANAVLNHLRPWLPTLVALGGNSPFANGRDTGFASSRIVQQSRFPGAGLPPYSASADEYEDRLSQLVECGALLDARTTFWLARLSQVYPTIEIRAADSALTVEDVLLIAALGRALVATALRDIRTGVEPLGFDEQIGAAAVWTAARYGLAGPGIDLALGDRVPARVLLDDLVRYVADALHESHESEWVDRMLYRLDLNGTGADRQRTMSRHGLDFMTGALALGVPSAALA